MLTIEQFLNGYQPKFDYKLTENYQQDDKRLLEDLPQNWKDIYFPILELIICDVRDKGQDGFTIKNIAGWIVDGKSKTFILTADEMDFVGGILKQRGFNVSKFLSIVGEKNYPTVEVSWPVDKIKKPDILKK